MSLDDVDGIVQKGLSRICGDLMSDGWDGMTPIAIIQEGTTARQRVVVSVIFYS